MYNERIVGDVDMIKNMIFDIGNVLVTFYPKAYFSQNFPDEIQCARICEEVFADEVWQLYDQGIYDKGDLSQIYKEKYPQDWQEISYVLEHWLSLMQLKEDTFAYVQAMKNQGYKIYLLSNISIDSAAYLKAAMPFFKVADGAVLSYEIKVNKPNRKIFEALFQRYQLQAQECIFFDDLPQNIAAANALGMHGIVFENMTQAAKEAADIIERGRLC